MLCGLKLLSHSDSIIRPDSTGLKLNWDIRYPSFLCLDSIIRPDSTGLKQKIGMRTLHRDLEDSIIRPDSTGLKHLGVYYEKNPPTLTALSDRIPRD